MRWLILFPRFAGNQVFTEIKFPNYNLSQEYHLYAQENKSAILTRLMQQAVEENKLKKRRYNAIDAILALREKQVMVSLDDINNAREQLRE